MFLSTLCLVAVGVTHGPMREKVFPENAGPSCGVVATAMVALASI